MDLVGLRLAPALIAGVIAYLHSETSARRSSSSRRCSPRFQLVERSGFPLA